VPTNLPAETCSLWKSRGRMPEFLKGQWYFQIPVTPTHHHSLSVPIDFFVCHYLTHSGRILTQLGLWNKHLRIQVTFLPSFIRKHRLQPGHPIHTRLIVYTKSSCMKPSANKKIISCTDLTWWPGESSPWPHCHKCNQRWTQLLQTQKASGKYGVCAVHQLKGDGHLK